jgi:hypothetical protein
VHGCCPNDTSHQLLEFGGRLSASSFEFSLEVRPCVVTGVRSCERLSTDLMDRDSQHRPRMLTPRAYELTTVSGHAVLLVTVDNKHNGCLLTTWYTQKYVTWAAFGTEPTDMRANGHVPITLLPHPPRTHCLHASVRLCRQQTSLFTSTSSGDSCAT